MPSGQLKKMSSCLGNQVEYTLNLCREVSMNDLLGQTIQLQWLGVIHCIKCSRVTRKSFGQGFCYPCFKTAPEAAECIIRPELCRAHLGEGRDPAWEEEHHNQPHVVYLAASSAVKVGITRSTQIPVRWIDQGATAAIRLAEVENRFQAGQLEVALKPIFTDRTHWQKMLCNDIDQSIDLVEEKWSLQDRLPHDMAAQFSDNDEVTHLNYPVIEYPAKVKSLSFDKTAVISGRLHGIKGQYLIFEGGNVLNIRKHAGYEVTLK